MIFFERGLELNDRKSILVAHINNAASYYCIGDIEEVFKSIASYYEVCYKYGDEADWVNLFDFEKDFVKAKEALEKGTALGKKIKKYNIVNNGYFYMVEEN